MNISASHADLFPTRIWTYDLSELSAHFEAWQQALQRWREREPGPAGRSNRRGWNSEKTVLLDPLFGPLLEAAKQAFGHALRQMIPSGELRFGLEAWANIHDPDGYNVMHVHPNALLSGCFYLSVPDGAGALVFRDPRPGVALSPFLTNGVNTNQKVQLAPKAGLLVLFPNWLEHAVDPNLADAARVSIAMNALLPSS